MNRAQRVAPAAAPPPSPGEPADQSQIRRAGFVAIIGRPNVGKSTLLNQIVGEKLAIASPRPQTTRDRLLGVKNHGDAQLALVDTPGIHRLDARGRTALNAFMVDEALQALGDVDVILVVTDLRALPEIPAEEEGQPPAPMETSVGADRAIWDKVVASAKPVVVAINKTDLLSDKRQLLPLMDAWSRLPAAKAIVPISAATGDGVDRLITALCADLPEGPALFPEEVITDRAERWLAAEFVREQVFLATQQEVPYAVAVTIEAWDDRVADRGRRRGERIGAMIHATIHVEKEAQKRILVGNRGTMIRDIGTAARQEIASLLGCPVHLELFVRVDEGWSGTIAGLRSMGYAPQTPSADSAHARPQKGA